MATIHATHSMCDTHCTNCGAGKSTLTIERECAPAPDVDADFLAPLAVEYVRIPRAALGALLNDIEQFHTAKQLRAWASEENATTKRMALARINALLCLGDA